LQLIHPAVQPAAGEVVVGKHRVNALYGTALDPILRANNIDTLIILGYATSGVVLSTVRYAADSDYRLVVVEDCCADQDPEVHDFLTRRIFPRQAEVVSAAEVMQALRS
jgi:nicotinamidase-related amidase